MQARPSVKTDQPGATKQRRQVMNEVQKSGGPVEPRQSTSNTRDSDRPLKNSMASGATNIFLFQNVFFFRNQQFQITRAFLYCSATVLTFVGSCRATAGKCQIF
jgi:hypothetical protein